MISFLTAAIRIATPVLLAARGGILSERAGVFSVGLEGMMRMGAFSAVVGAWASGSLLVGVGLALSRGAMIGRHPDRDCQVSRGQHGHGLTANIAVAALADPRPG